MLPRFTLPPSPLALAAMAAAFILPGLVSHDLWKTQDAIGLGIVHGMAVSGDLIVPRVAGTPWLHEPPFYHWVALVFGKLFSLVMEFHAAARLASGLFVALAFWLIYRAARRWSDEETGRTAAGAAFLILLGSVGLLVHAHEALPELASLAAMCGALAVLPHAQRRPLHSGLAFGAALGLAFLSATWIAPLSLAVAAAAACIVVPEWRTRSGSLFLAVAFVLALLLALAWPLALALRSGDDFLGWWQWQTTRQAPLAESVRHFFATGSWFTWPAWPLAVWTAWSLRRRWREPRLFIPGTAVVAMALLLILWGPPHDENLIPLLAPLSLFAAYGIFSLRRGAVAALDWFGVLTFAVFTGIVWLGYVALLTGVPAPMARNFARIAPGFVAQLEPFALLVAIALLLAWLFLIFFAPFTPMRGVARWAGGMVLLWGTLAMLWMPWVDYQKTYRSVALQLKSKMPVSAPCISQRGLGVSQAAALDYHGGIRAQPFDVVRPGTCPLVLVQGHPTHELDAPGSGASGKLRWTKLADVGRPGDRAERYRLYQLRR